MERIEALCLLELLYSGEENFLYKFSKFLCNRYKPVCECGVQLSTESFCLVFGDGGLYWNESDCNTWNIVCENTPKNPEVVIKAIVI